MTDPSISTPNTDAAPDQPVTIPSSKTRKVALSSNAKADAPKLSGRAFVEETPGLSREARDIILRHYANERKTAAEWQDKAADLGGLE